MTPILFAVLLQATATVLAATPTVPSAATAPVQSPVQSLAPSPAPSVPASATAPVLGAIGQQALPATGCAAYLWTTTEPHQLIAMATADAGLRVTLDAKPLDLPRQDATGAVAHGLAATSRYASGDVAATLDMTVVDRPGLTAGASVTDAVLRVDRAGHDELVVPLAGMVGCG